MSLIPRDQLLGGTFLGVGRPGYFPEIREMVSYVKGLEVAVIRGKLKRGIKVSPGGDYGFG